MQTESTGLTNSRPWLLGFGLIISVAVWVMPSLLIAPSRQPLWFGIGQIAVCGLVLGIGRQGIDLLVLRLVLASMGGPLGLVLYRLTTVHSACRGAHDCFQFALLGIGFQTLELAIATSVIALPTTILWQRGFGGLAPELTWPSGVPPWTWVVAGLVILLLVATLTYLAGIPAPP